jgi:hypothetical protein
MMMSFTSHSLIHLKTYSEALHSTTLTNCVQSNKEEQDHFEHFQSMTVGNSSEIMSNEWARKTQDSILGNNNFDPDQDFFLALMLYGDKTGTDINQQYPLEPWMLTLVLLQLTAREYPKNWKHLGFIPLQGLAL